MVVSFEPTDEFMYYADGVFVSGEEKIHQEWQKAPAGGPSQYDSRAVPFVQGEVPKLRRYLARTRSCHQIATR